MSSSNFTQLKLHTALQENLLSLGFSQMTPIQAQSLPLIINGKDVIGQAKTGSGKTAAFGLGLLQKLDVKNFNLQSLVLCPTRELAEQVAEEIRSLARKMANVKVIVVCGGIPKKIQTAALAKGVHIVVGTPGRVEEHLDAGTMKLDALTTLVLDEADRMLDMGFQPSIDAIINFAPKKRQTLLFSAIYPQEIESIAQRVMQKPELIQIDSSDDQPSIEQHFYKVQDDSQRLTATRLILLAQRPDSSMIFCNTKKEVKAVAGELKRFGFSVLALHGDLDQIERDQALIQFANKSTSVLVATDVAGRGLDIDALDLVINYHTASDPETHLHRIGRTGRAGNQGIACSLFSDKERYKISRLAEYLEFKIEAENLPDLALLKQPGFKAPMATLQISGGKKNKIRPGDIVGALTQSLDITGDDIGKIKVAANWSYVAVSRKLVDSAFRILTDEKIKGRKYRIKRIS
ncbi:ATP-dependent RNA helicase DbpA [Kangiella sp. TOML190]|uniref:ATP-dependent RNA helicase DbpA n=1 Tax=Kangiella sp. TOML190 TaxID=2931351 RepID=UPI0035DCD20C